MDLLRKNVNNINFLCEELYLLGLITQIINTMISKFHINIFIQS